MLHLMNEAQHAKNRRWGRCGIRPSVCSAEGSKPGASSRRIAVALRTVLCPRCVNLLPEGVGWPVRRREAARSRRFVGAEAVESRGGGGGDRGRACDLIMSRIGLDDRRGARRMVPRDGRMRWSSLVVVLGIMRTVLGRHSLGNAGYPSGAGRLSACCVTAPSAGMLVTRTQPTSSPVHHRSNRSTWRRGPAGLR